VAQGLAGIRGPSPPFDGESPDTEPMNFLGSTVLERLWMKYTRRRYLAASTSQSRKRCKSQNRSTLNGGWAISTCILNGGMSKWAGMEETC